MRRFRATGTPGAPTDGPNDGPNDGPTATPTVTAELPPVVVDALQAALAGEHAVVWAYGVLGPRVDEDGEDLALGLLTAHGTARDRLRASLVGAGATPVVAEPAYALPVAPTDAASAAELAAVVEQRLAAVYADLVAATNRGDLRSLAVDAVTTAAQRVAGWRGGAPAFPGMPERAEPGPDGRPNVAPSEPGAT